MTQTMAVREVGFPWFQRHATRGAREIFMFSRTREGVPHRTMIRSGTWPTSQAMQTYYATDDREIGLDLALGFVRGPDYATWEEAEAWLMAP